MVYPVKRKFLSSRRIAALVFVICAFYILPFHHPRDEVGGEEGKRRQPREETEEGEEESGKITDIHEGAEGEGTDRTLGAEKGRFPYNVLLLASMGRSGSSFLGGLLTSQSKTVYFFEPLHDIEALHLLTEKSAMKGLRDIFTCDIKDPILSTFIRNPNFVFKEFYKQCGRHQTCLTGEVINSRCKKKSVRVVKTIRTRVAWLQAILHDPEVNLKVIQLVRDPRASIISGWDRGWNLTAERACGWLTEDLHNGLELKIMYPEKYMAVRYEDLCDDPWGWAKKIYSFLGYTDLPLSTRSFLKKSTTGKDRNDAYGTKRNTRKMPQKWRSAITGDQLQVIQDACGSVISNIGFRVFQDLESARNYTVPLHIKSVNPLFAYDKPS
ncbi:carbohydrate sulfotransferase 3-like [Macrobrachium nipponense]|uniref:carbohydrate sulfotransferase 3-like n=1 Tax=Macrobrachium nipponense TaxID=159736 RepID=UPI0030C890EF